MRSPLPSASERALLPEDGGPEFNRLIHETSPYLLQHARNPVQWWSWGPQVFTRAKLEDKPIFLSVGYSTCHWCHVMEHESFEDPGVARILNQLYLPVKVDREERPDIDAIYMNATTLLTGHGGWPNSVWLTPDGRPFFAGTYFPPDDRHGRPGFKTLLVYWAEQWEQDRGQIEAQANEFARAVRENAGATRIAARGELSRALLNPLLDLLRKTFDGDRGGFGGAPKFPPHHALRILLYEYAKNKNKSALEMARATLDAMAHGGIHDHVGGGFHRYSTDAEWFLPHFEKMLYDNAMLGRTYAQAWELTKEAEYRRVAEGIFAWVEREMTHGEGGFYSALDADSEGEEGKFYVWTPKEVVAALGKKEGELFCRVFNVVDGGNFEEEATGGRTGASIAYLDRTWEELSAEEKQDARQMRDRMDAALVRLLAVRAGRVRPHLDDKVLAGWNGLMIGALAFGGQVFGDARRVEAAKRAAEFVLGRMRREDGRLLASWREGEARLPAYLDDYAFLADGLLDLHEATGEARWLEEAQGLADGVLAHFHDAGDGGFFFTAADHEKLLVRSKDPFDSALPSGNGVAARVFVRLAALTEEPRYAETARTTLEAFVGVMERAPRGAESFLLATAMLFDEAADEKAQAKRKVKAAEKKAKAQEKKEKSAEAKKPVEHKGEGGAKAGSALPSQGAGVSESGGAESAGPEVGEPVPVAQLRRKPITLEAFLSREGAAPGETVELELRIGIDPAWHIYAHDAGAEAEAVHATSLRAVESPQVRLGQVVYPEGRAMKASGGGAAPKIYEERVSLGAVLTVENSAGRGRTATLALELSLQCCTFNRCMQPETFMLEVPVKVL